MKSLPAPEKLSVSKHSSDTILLQWTMDSEGGSSKLLGYRVYVNGMEEGTVGGEVFVPGTPHVSQCAVLFLRFFALEHTSTQCFLAAFGYGQFDLHHFTHTKETCNLLAFA